MQHSLEQPQKGRWKPILEQFIEPCKDVQQVSRLLNGDMFLLDSGREVFLLQCHIERSALGCLCGRMDDIRADFVRELPERIQRRFSQSRIFIKPIPDGDLPVYLFMVSLESHQTVSDDGESTGSRLVVCWLTNHLDINLVECIDREIRSVDWDKHAEDWLP
jgi:hypothetical protein